MVTSKNSHELKILRKCYTEWKKPKPPHSNQWFIPLAGGNEFSLSFINCLGEGNTQNIQSIDDNLLRNITAALVEHEANLQAQKKVSMTEEFSLLQAVNIFWYSELVPDAFPRWGMRNPRQIKSGWTEFIHKKIFPKSSIWNVISSLANILGINSEYLDKQYNNTQNNLWNGEVCHFDRLPSTLDLPRRSSEVIISKLIEPHLLYDKSKKIIGAIAQYSFINNQTFCLAAANIDGILSVGKHQLSTCFLNQHLFDENPKWKIIFCQDIRAALMLQKIIKKSNPDAKYDLLVTGHLGTNLESFPWDFFYGHEIIFVPAPSKFSLSQIGYYKKFFLDADVNEFKIFPGFLLHSPPGVTLEQVKETLPSQEAALLRETVILDDKDMLLHGVQRIIERAISYESFIKWGQDLEFFRKPKEPESPNGCSEVQTLPPADPSEFPPAPLRLEDVVLHSIIRPGINVEVLGAKNSGKTQFALSICHALRKRDRLCSVFPYEANVPCKVAYIDAETPLAEFQANLKQYELDNDEGLFGLSNFDKDTQKLFPEFSLMNQEFRDTLRNFLLNKGCRYIVLDNLTALMGDDVNYGASAHKVIKFVEQLQNDGICIIIVHHLTKSGAGTQHGKASGSDFFNRRARAKIELKSKTDILNDSTTSETVRKFALHAGLTVGIRFTTCKAAPVLDDITFYAHLPLGESHWQPLGAYGLDGQAIELPTAKESLLPDKDTSVPPATGSPHDKLKDLTPDQRRAVEILKASPATRAEIKTQLNCCDDKALTVLNELIVMEVVRREGQGKATYYALNDYE